MTIKDEKVSLPDMEKFFLHKSLKISMFVFI